MCLVTHARNTRNQFRAIAEALARRFELTVRLVDDGWPRRIDDLAGPGVDPHGFDVVVFEVKFRQLLDRPPFDWGSYRGLHLMLDLDAFQNYSAMITRQYLGRWPEVFGANDFDVLVCSGEQVRDRLVAEGVPAVWIPKGYDAHRIRDLGDDRRARHLGYFGRQYPARRLMLERLSRAGIDVERVSCDFEDLNAHLNLFDAVLVCNMELWGARHVPARVMARLPAPFLKVRPGPEPMMKNFEVAGAGAAPVCDALADLAALGFRDGETMVSYETFAELVEKVREYDRAPERWREIGRRAGAFVAAHHTWDHRAAQFEQLVLERGPGARR